MAFPKNHLRFVPTLTHVVYPTENESRVAMAHLVEKNLTAGIDESKVQEIIQTIMPTFSAKLRDIAQSILDEKVCHLETEMRAQVEAMVRNAISRRETPING